jgi:hypothetical protein
MILALTGGDAGRHTDVAGLVGVRGQPWTGRGIGQVADPKIIQVADVAEAWSLLYWNRGSLEVLTDKDRLAQMTVAGSSR